LEKEYKIITIASLRWKSIFAKQVAALHAQDQRSGFRKSRESKPRSGLCSYYHGEKGWMNRVRETLGCISNIKMTSGDSQKRSGLIEKRAEYQKGIPEGGLNDG
jgi:hypothetical protein